MGTVAPASEQVKPPLAIRASTSVHRFQNDGVKRCWEVKGIRYAHAWTQSSKARWHKQCAERVCCIVVVVVAVFGWGANEWNEGGNEFHRWPVYNEEVLFE